MQKYVFSNDMDSTSPLFGSEYILRTVKQQNMYWRQWGVHSILDMNTNMSLCPMQVFIPLPNELFSCF